MERVNIVVLASLVAALTLFVLRLVSDNAGPHFLTRSADASGPIVGPDGVSDRRLPRSRIAMYGGAPDGRGQPPRAATPGAENRRESRPGAASGRSVLIAGFESRRDVLRSAWRAELDESDLPEREPLDVLAGRSAAIPRAGSESPPPAPSEPGVIEFVDDPPIDQGGADVLLRIPFDGRVDAEVGGGPFQVEGLVTGDGTVDFPEEARLSFPSGDNVNSASGTISFELRPHWAGSDGTNNSLVQIRNEHVWENTLSIVKNLDSLRFIIIDSSGVERNVNIPIPDWNAGEVHTLTATWDAAGMALYVNGQLAGQNTLPNPLRFSETTPIFIGSDYPGSTYAGAGGSMREFVVYARALGADEIARR
jgi:Concanavalin A-like lectin/glucanases superfamily